ncbi:MFS transporter [Siminovitchia sp. 179-K 8D1 HS]|uniref:MFS transporter n=1 Tax=Siminovitchia sp. 179-K 8D1 HS TaxID=3142385 RepID=UPI0039A0ED55
MERDRARSIYIVIGMLIGLVAISFARHSYGVILPFMKNGLSISNKSAGVLATVTSLGYLITIMMVGYLSTKFGGKNTILLGLLLLSIGFFNLGITTTYWHSSIFMFLLGVGTSFIFTPLIAILIEWFPQMKGFVIGCVNSSAGIGLLFVGILVPFLTDLYPESSWRLTWKIFCLISVFVFFLTILFIKNPPVKEASIQASQPSSPAKKIYTNPAVIKVGFIYGIVGMTLIIQSIFIISFMLDAGLGQQLTGQLISFSGIISIFSSPIWGGISDLIGRRNALILAMGLNFLSTIIPVYFSNAIGFTANLVIQGAVAIGIMTLVQALSTEQVSARDTPIAFSYVTFYFATGQFIGPTLAGWIIDYSGFKSAFIFSALCLCIGLYLTMKISKESMLENSISAKR